MECQGAVLGCSPGCGPRVQFYCGVVAASVAPVNAPLEQRLPQPNGGTRTLLGWDQGSARAHLSMYRSSSDCPSPNLVAAADRTTGPSCNGSPASTTCPPRPGQTALTTAQITCSSGGRASAGEEHQRGKRAQRKASVALGYCIPIPLQPGADDDAGAAHLGLGGVPRLVHSDHMKATAVKPEQHLRQRWAQGAVGTSLAC